MFVEELETAALAFVPGIETKLKTPHTSKNLNVSPVLLLYSFRSLDVNYFVELQLCLVGVLGTVDHPGPVSLPENIFCQFPQNVSRRPRHQT